MLQASEARSLDRLQTYAYEQEQTVRRNFGVRKGQGLDAEVRKGISSLFYARFKMALAAIVVLSIFAGVRISLTAATASVMQDCRAMQNTIEEARGERSNLLIVRSSLMSASRIDSIATQNLGMVYPESTESINVASSGTAATPAK